MSYLEAYDSTWAKDLLQKIDQGHARGNRKALLVRSAIQCVLRKFGGVAQRHCGKVIMLGFIPLIVFAFGLTRAKLETDAENLWIEVGGRLEKEIEYTKKSIGEGYGATSELLIQTPNMEGTNILKVKEMKQHLEALTVATNISVEIFEQIWSLKDLCYTLSFPLLGDNILDTILPQLLPCLIITPLDCFWEGSIPLGPRYKQNLGEENSSGDFQWSKINPEELINWFKPRMDKIVFEKTMALFREAGISSGYVKKPCLDPKNPECPFSAPNFSTKKKPDVGVELTGGCQGFATKFMDWPEELLVGGVIKNQSQVIRSAKAYQSIIMLRGSQQLHNYWHGKAKVNHLEWTEETASQVLEAWKREFTKTMNTRSVKQEKEDSTVLAFSSTSFNDLLQDFSKTSYSKVGIGYGLMLVYACLTLIHWSDPVESHGALGFAGVLLVTVAVSSGLGFCSFIGIKFNAASTQILPFLALGLGVDDMFLLAHTYSTARDKKEPVAYCLASTGVSVFLTSFNNMFAFFMAALIPIPALRSFSFQAAIVVAFNFYAVIVIFPAMIAIDKCRRKAAKYDMFCCLGRTGPQRISITPSISGESSFVHYRYHNSCNSLLDNSAIVQGLSGTVILPGTVQATASQTIHLPRVVTVQASASAEVDNQPTAQHQHKRGQGKKPWPVSESDEIDLSAFGNAQDSNGDCHTKARAEATTNIVQVQMAADQKTIKDSVVRPLHHGYNRTLKIHPETSTANSCTCSEGILDQRIKSFAAESHSRDCILNENAKCAAQPKDSVINENAVLFTKRTDSKSYPQAQSVPANVQIQVSANAASSSRTAVARAECSSTHGSLRTVSSQTRSSPGIESMGRASTAQSQQEHSTNVVKNCWQKVTEKLEMYSLSCIARDYYGPWLQQMPVKITVLFMFACFFAAGLYGCMKVEEGLDLTDVVPRKSPEHKFVEAQFKYFSFYQIAAVTMEDYDYPNGQELLYKFHDAFRQIPNIIKTPANDLPKFWLIYFREWLEVLQEAFDKDWEAKKITYEGWLDDASDEAVIGYKLLAQTGEKETINRSIVRDVRLVSKDGIIRPETFYKYLMVWYNVDVMGYTMSQANIKPEPEASWFNKRSSQDYNAMRVEPPSPPINFSYIPFNLINIRETKDFIEAIKSIRAICDEFSAQGLPNYPTGIPFIFWEQYIWLGEHLMVAVAIVLAASFVVMALILCNVWASMFVVIVLIMITVELYGFMGLTGIKLSAVPAVTLILSVGVGVEFTVHMCMQFLTSTGDRNQRMQRAVEHVFSPVVDGAISTLLGVVMLAGSDFDFIVRYFFHLLAALIVIGTLNGLVFLPVLLSLVGPGPEIEEITPPRALSSAESNREFLPSSTCRQRTPPSDSELCIVGKQEELSSGSVKKSHRHKSRNAHKSKSRGNTRPRPRQNRSPPPVDSDSSSSTVTRVTARATVTVEVHTSERSSYPNYRGGAQLVGAVHNEGDGNEDEMRITNLEEFDGDIRR
ncbi:protein patched homolog 1-like isoform X2 [Acropora palmata]|uniref:protein patched homolog 1-like isoform X2 n=1 Tax=Acropora palmata TaxID=6131 RepID=UPI003DA10882